MKNFALVLLFIFSQSLLAQTPMTMAQLTKHLGYSNYAESEKLTDDESWAIMAYTFTDETDYKDMNGYLRFGENYDLYNQTPKSVQKLIDDVISGMHKFPKIPKNVKLYRGTTLKYRGNKCFTQGEKLDEKAFLSTSLSKKVAKHFAFSMNSGKGALLTLKLNSQQTGLLITENNEAEILFPPGKKITITSSGEVNGKCYAEGVIY